MKFTYSNTIETLDRNALAYHLRTIATEIELLSPRAIKETGGIPGCHWEVVGLNQ